MPVVPDFLERLALLRLHLAPAPMLDLLGAQGFRVLAAANALGVFDVLAEGPASAETVAERIGARVRGTQLLLEALEALRYLKRRGQGYQMTRMARRWLPIVRPGLEYFAWETLERWDHLEVAVRDGTPAPDRQRDAAFQRMYQAGMRTVAALTVDEVVAKVRVPADARRLVDVGGVFFCETMTSDGDFQPEAVLADPQTRVAKSGTRIWVSRAELTEELEAAGFIVEHQEARDDRDGAGDLLLTIARR